MHSFSSAMALELDRAALRGSGTPPEPRGVRNQTGVSVISQGANGADLLVSDVITDLIAPIQDANETPTAIISAPRSARFLANTKDANGNPLTIPTIVGDLPWYTTKQIPTNQTVGSSTDTSEIYAGDWSKLLICVRHELSVQVLQERYADYLQVGFVAWLRADIQVARPAAFAVLTGVRGTA